MTIEKIKFIQQRICEGESPCTCIPNFKCPFLDEKGSCILYYNNTDEKKIFSECDKAFIKWIEEDTFYQIEEGDDADDEEEWCDENCAECEYKTLCSGSPFKK